MGVNQTSESISKAVEDVRLNFNSGITKTLEFRKQQLKCIINMLEKESHQIYKAIAEDLKRPLFESKLFEVDYCIKDIQYTIDHFEEWAQSEKAAKTIGYILNDMQVQKEPYGVVLVIAPWNYPFQTLLIPMATAIAAGNVVILKPSEISSASAKVLDKIIPQYMDERIVRVISGGIDESTVLLNERFDYIFFTGSTTVGRIVHQAASKYLTPTTLELGGKSPVYVDDSVNLVTVAERLMWGKLINAGQNCISPDYLLCTKKIQNELLTIIRNLLKTWYGNDIKKSSDLSRIINAQHCKRLSELINADKVAIGGTVDLDDLYVEPTVMVNVSPEDKIMQEEIFGPILPIINVNDAKEAVEFIRQREKPLALYVFSKKKDVLSLFESQTSSGALVFNITMAHMAADSLPFGGVGSSGMGNYHGKFGFDTFTHQKGFLSYDYNPIINKIASKRYPPYTDFNIKIITMLCSKIAVPSLSASMKFIFYILSFLLGWYLCLYKQKITST